MKRQRWFLLGLIMVLVFSWAPVALASQVFFDFEISFQGYDYDGNSNLAHVDPFGLSGWLEVTATPGLFSRQGIAHFAEYTGYSAFRPYLTDPWEIVYEPSFFPFGAPPAQIIYSVAVDQSGPLRFTDLAWKLTMLNGGSETTLWNGSADFNLITNGGEKWGWSFPVLEENTDFIYSLTGNVVDPAAPAPLPSALLLLGSGLVPLALYGRRKLVSRK